MRNDFFSSIDTFEGSFEYHSKAWKIEHTAQIQPSAALVTSFWDTAILICRNSMVQIYKSGSLFNPRGCVFIIKEEAGREEADACIVLGVRPLPASPSLTGEHNSSSWSKEYLRTPGWHLTASLCPYIKLSMIA